MQKGSSSEKGNGKPGGGKDPRIEMKLPRRKRTMGRQTSRTRVRVEVPRKIFPVQIHLQMGMKALLTLGNQN